LKSKVIFLSLTILPHDHNPNNDKYVIKRACQSTNLGLIAARGEQKKPRHLPVRGDLGRDKEVDSCKVGAIITSGIQMNEQIENEET
jgi:hypothetical protein